MSLKTSVKVAKRFLATAPKAPPWMEAAVKNGELDERVLTAWKDVASTIEDHYNSGSALVYWQTKCRQIGVKVPASTVEEGDDQEYAVRPDDRVEDWKHQEQRSERMVEDIEGMIETVKGEVRGDSSKTMTGLNKTLDGLDDALSRYALHGSPAIAFEREFQFLAILVKKQFDRAGVGKPSSLLSQFKGNKDESAELVDLIGDLSSSLDGLTSRIDRLLTKAGA